MKEQLLSPLEQDYQNLITRGEIIADAAQFALVKRLGLLVENLQKKPPRSLWSLIGKRYGKNQPPKGLYIYGKVGRGKTMLMDLFYKSLKIRNKKRIHFNEFMKNIQTRLEHQRQQIKAGSTKSNDPIPPVAAALIQEASVLCFDEFSVTDIADAMILSRLFASIFAQGGVLVATSNVAPDDLYKNGLNRALFLPFIQILKNHVELFNLDAPTDYRLEKHIEHPLYLYPLDAKTAQKMDAAFSALTGNNKAKKEVIERQGREMIVPQASGNVVRFDFSDLCAKPLGFEDYAILAEKYNHFFIDNVPILDNNSRNEAKRFIMLIDTLYDRQARAFISAAAAPDKLYQSSFPTTESFEFNRTVSRLYEMQSEEYLTSGAVARSEKDHNKNNKL